MVYSGNRLLGKGGFMKKAALIAALVFTLALLNPIPTFADDHGDDSTTATPASASGQAVAGTIDHAGDQDWFSFAAVAGKTYRLETGKLAGGMDTVLYLIDPPAS